MGNLEVRKSGSPGVRKSLVVDGNEVIAVIFQGLESISIELPKQLFRFGLRWLRRPKPSICSNI